MNLEIFESIAEISPTEWNALSGPNDPFTSHAFFAALEESNSVGSQAGWLPIYITLKQNNDIRGILPLYLKNHSYGEYIFDWSWADASERAGIPYFPKLVSAVPFTPATGPRFLMKSTNDTDVLHLWNGALDIADSTEASSIHVLFLPEEQMPPLAKKALPRWTHQYHWTNPGVDTFDAWLGLFRSKDRKKIRAERRRAQQSVDRIYHLTGRELTAKHVAAVWEFYQRTAARKWGNPYLTKAFFMELNRSLADSTVVFFAEKNKELVASSLCFQKGENLYGRYWGCQSYNDCLHFELCYHQPIELAIQRGWKRFEAGAQGEHKIKRGLMPTKIYSAHWLRHPGLQQGIARFLEQERAATERTISMLSTHGPFKRGPS